MEPREIWERLREIHASSLAVGAELEQLTQQRNAALAELHRAGHSYQTIAQEIGLTRGRVAQIVRQQKQSTIGRGRGGQKSSV